MSHDVEVTFVKEDDKVNSIRYEQIAPRTAAIEHLYLARAILRKLAIDTPERLRVTIHFDD